MSFVFSLLLLLTFSKPVLLRFVARWSVFVFSNGRCCARALRLIKVVGFRFPSVLPALTVF